MAEDFSGGWMVRQAEVRGEIVDATPPRPIRVLLHPHGAEEMTVDGWAMAWTKTEVLIYYRPGQVREPILAWVRADAVRRR